MIQSIASLNKEEHKSLYDTWPSIYPLLYFELDKVCKKRIFSFNNEEIATLFTSLKRSKNKVEAVQRQYEFISKIFDLFIRVEDKREDLFSDDNLKEYLYTFFAWNKVTKDEVFKIRKSFLKNSYEEAASLKNIFWRHDGWWNCYYGKILDEEAITILEEELKKINSIYDKTKLVLTLAYRYSELGQFKKGKKLIKKTLRFYMLKLFLFSLSQKEFPKWMLRPYFIKDSLFIRFIYSLSSFYSSFSRYSVNMLMYLYRSENKKRKKLRIINKIIRQNNLTRLFLTDTFSKFINRTYYGNKMYIRPQHILRIIEVLIDKYVLKPDEKIKDKIKYLFELIFTFQVQKYYKENGLIQYFVFTEIYLTLYYYIKKVVIGEEDAERFDWIG